MPEFFQLSALLTAPEVYILPYLPEILDGLFQMLDDGQPGVRDATETVLGQFLERIHEPKTDDMVAFMQYWQSLDRQY